MLPHTSVCHAVVFCLDNDCYVLGLGVFLQFLRYLCGHLFLYLWSLYYVMHYPVELTQSNDLTVGNDANPCLAHYVLEVMRTRGSDRYRTRCVHALVTHVGKLVTLGIGLNLP